ncbi:MAG: APC family permease [Bacillota bacterium]
MSSENNSLVRVLGRWDVLVLAFGAMIGWGWVVLAGEWANTGGSLGGMLAFLLGGIMVIFIGLAYAELTTAIPKAGGELFFSWRGLGVGASFICTWAIILGYISVVAFEAVALPTVVEYIVPGYKVGYLWTIAGWDVYATWVLVGMLGSVLVAVVNYLGIRPAAVFQATLTAGLAIIGVMFITGSLFTGSTEAMQPFFVDGWKGIVAVMVMTPFMFVGFDVIPQAAEEINIPYRSIGLILLASVLMAVAWYMFIIFGVSRALPFEARNFASLATADAMAAVFKSPVAAKLLILGGICGIMTSWNAFYIGGSRALYAMARAKMLPEFLGALHPKYKTPHNAIILIGILSTLAPLLGRKMLVWLVDAGGFAVVVAWVLVAASFLALRSKEPQMPRPFLVPQGKLVGTIAVVLSGFFVLLYLPGVSPAALVWPYEWAMVLGWSLLGLIFYVWAKAAYGNAADGILRGIVVDHEKSTYGR